MLGFHHFGSFLLFLATALFIVSTVTSPVTTDISMLKITLTNSSDIRHSSVTFGVLGHCVLDVAPASTDQDYCSKMSVGYNISQVISQTTGVNYNDSPVNSLTKVFVLHPVVAALSFFAFLIIACSGRLGHLFGVFLGLLTFLVALIVLAIDAAVFVVVKNHVNRDGSGATAMYGPGFWTMIVGTIFIFFGSVLSCCGCIRARNK